MTWLNGRMSRWKASWTRILSILFRRRVLATLRPRLLTANYILWSFCHRNPCTDSYCETSFLRSSLRDLQLTFLAQISKLKKSLQSDFQDQMSSDHKPWVCFRCCQKPKYRLCRWSLKLNVYWILCIWQLSLSLCWFDKRYFDPQLHKFNRFIPESPS
jgi:hypothetical protein